MIQNEGVLQEVFDVIIDRRQNPKDGSYTNYLFEKGIDKVLKKVGEECTETIIAAKNPDKELLVGEISDLIYHLSVMMAMRELSWGDVFEELEKRELKSSNLKKRNHPESVSEY